MFQCWKIIMQNKVRVPKNVILPPLNGNKKNRCYGDRIAMPLNKIQ